MNSAAVANALMACPAGDYISPNLEAVWLDYAFPNMTIGDVGSSTWPYLRREIKHNWYVDRRNPTVGFLDRDEVTILFNSALLFAGKPALEIGCWRGWSTAHCAKATGTLDVIDPILKDGDFFSDVRSSLARAGVLDAITFYPDTSPEAVEGVATASQKLWSFAFIDGDHEGDAPRLDAEMVSRFAAKSALILFHDLNAPSVAAGLDYLRQTGWNTMVYQTMQIMGVAWRGLVSPVKHTPDPEQPWTLPDHLVGFTVSGARPSQVTPRESFAYTQALQEHVKSEERLRAELSAANEGRTELQNLTQSLNEELALANDERSRLQSLTQSVGGKLSMLSGEIASLHSSRETSLNQVREVEGQNAANRLSLSRLEGERDTLALLLSGMQNKFVESSRRVSELDHARRALEENLAAKRAEAAERERVVAQQAAELAGYATSQTQQAELTHQIAHLKEKLDAATVLNSGATADPAELSRMAAVGAKIHGGRQIILSSLDSFEIARQRTQLDLLGFQSAQDLAAYIGRSRVLLGLFRRRIFLGRDAPAKQVEKICLGLATPMAPQVRESFAAWFSNRRDLLGLARRVLLGRAIEVKALILWRLNECLRAESSGTLPAGERLAELHQVQFQLEAELLNLIASIKVSDLAAIQKRYQEELAALAVQIKELQAQNARGETRFRELEAAKLLDENSLLSAEIELAGLKAQSRTS